MSGGNGSYTYIWYKNSEIIHTPISSGAPTLVDPTTLTGLTAGEYRVIAQDVPVLALRVRPLARFKQFSM